MFASTKSKVAAAVVLLALAIVPAPLLPPLGLTGRVQSLLGVSWQTAYLAAAIGLHMALYGALGVMAAFAVGPGKTPRQRWLREDWVRHYCLSAALAVVENTLISDAGGLLRPIYEFSW
jgi:hypothetical protein